MNIIKIAICLLLIVGMITFVSCVKNQKKNPSEGVATQNEVVQIPNPIEKSSLDGIMQTLGVKFSVPTDATNIQLFQKRLDKQISFGMELSVAQESSQLTKLNFEIFLVFITTGKTKQLAKWATIKLK